MKTFMVEEASISGVVEVVVALGPGEPVIAVEVYNREGCFLPSFEVLTSEEEYFLFLLGDTQPAVGARAGSGVGSFSVFFLGAIAYLGSEVYKVDEDSVNVELHCEEKYGAVEVRGLHNQIRSTK